MDSRGAVDLSSVDVSVMSIPNAVGYGGRPLPGVRWMPDGAQDALAWLFAASVLQALVVHVRGERGSRFGLDTRDIETVTVGQLSALVQAHQGSAGQGFELAICDALNAGVPEVCDAVIEALEEVGVRMRTPRGIVMGLEKVSDPQALAAAVAVAVGDRRLMTGRRGRPAHASRAVEALLAGGTQITANRGALAAADLLVYDGDGDSTVTASVKIRPGGWSLRPEQELPRLWITSGFRSNVRSRLPPELAVATVGDSLLQLYLNAHRQVVAALHGVNVGRMSVHARSPVSQVLQRARNQPVAAALAELRERADMVYADYGIAVPDLAAPRSDVARIEALDVPGEFRRYAEGETRSGLRVLHARSLTDLVLPHDQFFRVRAA